MSPLEPQPAPSPAELPLPTFPPAPIPGVQPSVLITAEEGTQFGYSVWLLEDTNADGKRELLATTSPTGSGRTGSPTRCEAGT